MKKRLKAVAKKALEILEISGRSLEIFLIPNSVMREINREYRGEDKETNILSFPAVDMPYPGERQTRLGEIYLAPKYISAHNEDIEYLLTHGILHLLGYTHEQSERKRMIMRKKEDEIIKKLALWRTTQY